MIKILLILLFGCSTFMLGILFDRKILQRKCKRDKKRIPKLCELKGKEFREYMDYLTKDL